MNPFQSLTALAREAVGKALEDGSLAIDATVGNGHDTLFLAGEVASRGQVIGFDVQLQALEGTRKRLSGSGLESLVSLHLSGHENMSTQVPGDWTGRVSAVMFNLGYLPGGDKWLTTHPASTLQALNQALLLLRTGGVISLLVYRGHPGAKAEAEAVLAWLDQLGGDFLVTGHASPGPVLYLIKRLA